MIETIISLPVLISGAIMDFKYRKVFIRPFIMASACGIIVNAAVYKRVLNTMHWVWDCRCYWYLYALYPKRLWD